MISIKSAREIGLMRTSGQIVARAHQAVAQMIRPGVTTRDIERAVGRAIEASGGKSSTIGYNGFPSLCCVSVNEVVIHGIPDDRVLRDGDIVSVDISAYKDGYHADAAKTFVVGDVAPEAVRLVEVTRQSFYRALKLAHPGHRISDLSHAVQSFVESQGFSVVTAFTGHGVGASLHEEPDVPNYGSPGHGARLLPGMTIAVEPMVCQGRPEVKILSDGWTVVPRDGGLSAHYEHTVLITDGQPELLTALKAE